MASEIDPKNLENSIRVLNNTIYLLENGKFEGKHAPSIVEAAGLLHNIVEDTKKTLIVLHRKKIVEEETTHGTEQAESNEETGQTEEATVAAK